MNDTAARITNILRRRPQIELAILFGSSAAGRDCPDSDIDLAVGYGRPLTVCERIALIEAIAKALGRPVDLVDLARAGEPLLGQILTRGKRLIGDDHHFASLLSRHWLDRADFQPLRDRILAHRRSAWIGK